MINWIKDLLIEMQDPGIHMVTTSDPRPYTEQTRERIKQYNEARIKMGWHVDACRHGRYW